MYYLYWLHTFRKYTVANEEQHQFMLHNVPLAYMGIKAENRQELDNFAQYLWENHYKQQLDNLEFLWNLYQTTNT